MKHKYKLSAIALAYTLAMGLGGTALAQTTADINQSGQDNAAYAEQAGNSNGNITASIVQSGNSNRAGHADSSTVSATAGGIWQQGNQGTTSARISQSGNGNLGMIIQEGVTSKYARVTQQGNGNTGTITQQGGIGGGATLLQNGDSHSAKIMLQPGNYNPAFNAGVVEVSQFSQGNRAEVVHMGRGKTTVVQVGVNNAARLESYANLFSGLTVGQYGNFNTVTASSLGSVQQYGDRNSASLLGFVQNYRGPSDDYSIRGTINQMGYDNSAYINQTSSAGGGFASIDQWGSRNAASIEVAGRYGARTQIGQRGADNSASIMQGSFESRDVSISQQGTGNRSTVRQTSFADDQASTVQNGDYNTAEIVQAAYLFNEASITQDGYRNRAVIAQNGRESSSNVARITQQGNDLQAVISQNGTSNRAAIRQR